METDRGPSGVGNLPDPGGRLHPDEALPSVVESAAKSAALVIPWCNFWTQETRLGRDQLIEQISEFHNSRGGKSECVVLDFRGPKNIAGRRLAADRGRRGPDRWLLAGRAAAQRVARHQRGSSPTGGRAGKPGVLPQMRTVWRRVDSAGNAGFPSDLVVAFG